MDIRKEKLTGIILDGGKSSRMGQNKGELFLGEKTFIEIQIEKLIKFCSEIIVITNNQHLNLINISSYKDIYLNKGPLGGIYTGLHYSKTELNLFVSNDLPFVNYYILKKIIDSCTNSEICVSRFSNLIEPIPGIYKKSLKTRVAKMIETDDLKLRNLFKYSIVKIQNFENNEIPDFSFNNINTKEDYSEACLILEKYINFKFK